MGRTWGGIAMIAGGVVLASTMQEVCVVSLFLAGCVSEWHRPLGFTGIGMATVGVLLTSVWADVPVARSLDVQVSSDRVTVGRAFGW